ncbi:mitochondrial calcium uniporter regulator 1 isoform X1 [Sphaerodactylus townsendi]|uniref:mitochondrial calcium uniporter regulator 1 isoform X1 n=1 Tax=Sphaerodactylus townsendi TaxID=933632 RepID=UPI002025C953|nr:mitochondrial calcium uniporter regulator 1 isoform X1 [Sphaerodactylus townsendi]
MVRGPAAAVVLIVGGKERVFLIQRGRRGFLSGATRNVVARSPLSRRCLGDWKRAGNGAPGVGGAYLAPAGLERSGPTARGSFGARSRFLSLHVARCLAAGQRDANIRAAPLQLENRKAGFLPSGSKKFYFDTHALVSLMEENGFTTQQSEIIVSALINTINSNVAVMYKDIVTKVQQEIALQQIMSHIDVLKKDMIILEKSEFSTLRSENEKIQLELQQLKKQVMDETSKVRTDSKLDFNLEKSRVKELYSLNDRRLLKMRTEIVELHSQQDRALTKTNRKIDTEVAGLKTMLESHKLDNIKYLAGSVFTCLTVVLGFYRLWI